METYGWFKDEYEKAKDTFEFKLEELEIQLSEKILERMDECGINRSGLAKKMKTSNAYISKLFNNGSNMTLKTMLALAEAIDCSISIDFVEKAKKYQSENYCVGQKNEYPQASDDYYVNYGDFGDVSACC